jgi:hypothetical protein
MDISMEEHALSMSTAQRSNHEFGSDSESRRSESQSELGPSGRIDWICGPEMVGAYDNEFSPSLSLTRVNSWPLLMLYLVSKEV